MSNENAHKRLTQAIEYLRNNGKARTHQEIADLMGARQPHISSAINGDPKRLTKGFLKRFAAAYSEYINAEYLIDGTGPMERPAKHTRPHIPMSVAAGPTGVAITTVAESDVEHHSIIDSMPSYDFTIGVMGDSMLPILSDGDTVACRRLESSDQIKPEALYVVETTDGAVVKQISCVTTDALTLHSLNPAFADYTIAPTSVLSISRVVGLIRPLTI